MDKVKSTATKTEDGHIEIGLPIKESVPNLHSNLQQAEKSLRGLKTRFKKSQKTSIVQKTAGISLTMESIINRNGNSVLSSTVA